MCARLGRIVVRSFCRQVCPSLVVLLVLLLTLFAVRVISHNCLYKPATVIGIGIKLATQ